MCVNPLPAPPPPLPWTQSDTSDRRVRPPRHSTELVLSSMLASPVAIASAWTTDPLVWLGVSLLLAIASLVAVLLAALPALQEVARAARSAEKLFDTLQQELPATLEAIRLTGTELSELSDEVNSGVKSASGLVQQANKGAEVARERAGNVAIRTRSVAAGLRAAWKTLRQPAPQHRETPQPMRSPQLGESEARPFDPARDRQYEPTEKEP